MAEIRGVRMSGVPAWVTWLVVHLWYLIGFQNRVVVLIRWAFSLATRGRGARLITGEEGEAPGTAGREDDASTPREEEDASVSTRDG